MSQPETCSDCGQPKPIKLVLHNPEGEDRKLCQVCSTRWLLSDEEWPPPTTSKSENKTSSVTATENTV